jgi:acetyltransferase
MDRWTLRDGTPVTIRPIRPEDEPLLVDFHESLSPRTVYLRYLKDLKLSQRVAHERLARLCFIDYNREMALVAVHRDEPSVEAQVIGIARLSRLHNSDLADFAVVISDAYQGQGLGRELLRRLLDVGRDLGIRRIRGNVLSDNADMIRLAEDLDFAVRPVEGEPIVRVEKELA